MIFHIKNKVRKLSYTNNFINKLYLIANRIKVLLLLPLSDEKKENTGRKLDLENPKTFNEKFLQK